MRPGPDKAYLTSEAAWRAGDVHRAAATLAAHAARCGGVPLPPKLAAAASFVDGLVRLDDELTCALACGDSAAAAAAAGGLLAASPRAGAPGLAARALAARGRAALDAGDAASAAADATAALALVPDLAAGLVLAGDAAAAAGDTEAAFLALRTAASRDAAHTAAASAAAAALLTQGGTRTPCADSRPTAGPAWAYEALGLPRGASRGAVRAAFRAAAAAAHPDKVGGDGAEFVRVRRAYEAILAAGVRVV